MNYFEDLAREDIKVKDENIEFLFTIQDDVCRLNWVQSRNKSVRMTFVFKQFITALQKLGVRKITANCIRGNFQRVKCNGYYTLLKWGFIPEGGRGFINKFITPEYDAFWFFTELNSSELSQWRENGESFEGVFYLDQDSFSMRMFMRTYQEKIANLINSYQTSSKPVRIDDIWKVGRHKAHSYPANVHRASCDPYKKEGLHEVSVFKIEEDGRE